MQINQSLKNFITEQLSALLGAGRGSWSFLPLGGGSINLSFLVQNNLEKVFCKINDRKRFPGLFEKESAGLELIRSKKCIRVPEKIACFEWDEWQVLLLEWIPPGSPDHLFWERFGNELAALHQETQDFFGLDHDNYMGSLRQENTEMQEWNRFFAEKRLEPMVDKCRKGNLLSAKDEAAFGRLMEKLGQIFPREIKPSFQHGDLWSGNFMCRENGDPVLIDPAVYFGHPSVDLGMTRIFGGFDELFYRAYQHHSKLTDGFREQCAVANLYPLLIHLYLFGSSYLPQIRSCLHQFA
jgi:fructosamine-3-kinase